MSLDGGKGARSVYSTFPIGRFVAYVQMPDFSGFFADHQDGGGRGGACRRPLSSAPDENCIINLGCEMNRFNGNAASCLDDFFHHLPTRRFLLQPVSLLEMMRTIFPSDRVSWSFGDGW